jgi:hypothetical protein
VKRLVSLYAFVVFLTALGAAAIVIGLHDAAIASGRIGLTALSVLSLVVGVVLLVAASSLLRFRSQSTSLDGEHPHCKPIVVIGFLLTIVVGIYVFFAAVGSEGTQRLLVIVAAVTLIIVGLLGFRSFGHHVRLTQLRVEAAIALGVLGIAAGAGQFWFQNQYIPSHAGRAVALEVSMSRAGRQNSYEVIRARIAYRAVGGRSVSVIGSAYTLTGSRVIRCHRPATPLRVQDVFQGFLVDPQTSRYMTDVREERPATVLAASKFVGDGKRLDPNVPATRELVFFVPRHRYQLLRLRAQLFAIPASVRLSRHAKPEFGNLPGDNELYGFWQVVDESWLHAVIYGRARWVVIRYEFVDPDHVGNTALSDAVRATARFPSPTWRERKPSAALVHRLFAQPQPSDSSEPFSGAELALESVAEPGPADPPSCKARTPRRAK